MSSWFRKWLRVWLAAVAMVIALGGLVTADDGDVAWQAIATLCVALAVLCGEDWA